LDAIYKLTTYADKLRSCWRCSDVVAEDGRRWTRWPRARDAAVIRRSGVAGGALAMRVDDVEAVTAYDGGYKRRLGRAMSRPETN